MSSFGIRICLFTTLLLASILSLSVGNDYLFSTYGFVLVSQGGFTLQPVHAQEQDEETDGTEDEEDEEEIVFQTVLTKTKLAANGWA
jgi:hypothetical protein